MKKTNVKKSALKHPRIIVIVGPTASGKSALAVRLAKKFSGEIISADSRQVYKGLDIGSGKITKREMEGIPHHLLGVVSPKRRFSAAQFQSKAHRAIAEILSRGKLPIIAGGTGFYIQTIVDSISLPKVPPNRILRKKLEKVSPKNLFTILRKLDPNRAIKIDRHNRHRLIRAIEIAKMLGSVPKLKGKSSYRVLMIGIKAPQKTLHKKIHNRLLARLRASMVREAKNLHSKGLSWKRLEELGLEYRYLAFYLQKKLSKKEMVTQLETSIRQYAKRQMTWFKRDKHIEWFSPTSVRKIEITVRKSLAD